MKLISVIPALGLLVFVLLIVSVVIACSPTNKVGTVPKEKINQEVEDSGIIVHRSLSLTGDAYKVVNELANGIQRRDVGECLMLNIDGLKLEGDGQIGINVFLNDTNANSETSNKSEHLIDSFIPGHGSRSENGESYLFSIDKTVETLGDNLLAELDRGAVDISLVAFPVFGDPSVMDKVSFTVKSVSIDVKCD